MTLHQRDCREVLAGLPAPPDLRAAATADTQPGATMAAAEQDEENEIETRGVLTVRVPRKVLATGTVRLRLTKQAEDADR